MTDIPAPTRSRWVYAPLVLVLLLALIWTGVWFYAAHRVEGTLSAWIEREARLGRGYECGERSVGGYPFRIEVQCRNVTVTLSGEGEPVVLKAAHVLAVAQVYQPDLVITEATGPMTVASAKGEPIYSANWKLLQASLRGLPRAPERISLVIDAPKLEQPGTNGQAAPVAQAERLEMHARRNPQADASSPAYDLYTRVSAAHVPALPALAQGPIQGEAAATLRGLTDFTGRKPFSARLREWQASGGKLEITRARLERGETLAVAQGDVRLNAEGRLDGTLDLKVAGLDQLSGLIFGQANSARGQNAALAGLAMLSRAELEGKRAIAVPLSFRDGRIFLGPIRVGQAGPLF